MNFLLLIDNFDSFTHNVAHAFESLGASVCIVRNNEWSVEECISKHPSHIVVGPGPGNPAQAGISKELILRAFEKKTPLLGICLGHQAIGEVFGGSVVRAKSAMHGKLSPIAHTGQGVFRKIPQPLSIARYHSLIVERSSLPDCLELTAWTQEGEVMGLKHRFAPIEGVQFHPESVASEYGAELLSNFLQS